MEFEEFDIEFLALKMAENPQSMLFARLADLYIGKEQPAEAMPLLEEGIKNFPEYYAGYIVLGKAHLAFKEYSRAQSAFEKALELSPFNQTAAKLLVSVPNKPDESTRTTDENYFTPPVQTQDEEPQQVFAEPMQEGPFTGADLSDLSAGSENEPSLLEQLQAEEDARLRAEAESGLQSSVYQETVTDPFTYTAEPEVQQQPSEPFPSYDEYFAQNQSRINTQDPISLDEHLSTEQNMTPSFVEDRFVAPSIDDDPFTIPEVTHTVASVEPHEEPEPVFANPEQEALFAQMNAINEEIAEEETAAPASLDIDSLAEKLQSAEKIVPQENYQPQNPVPKETQDDQAYETDAVTPTLAEIYASQGEYRAAIQAYEILMFSVPAKGADYQARIRQLQQMQMEKDGLI
jgi:tetratricopeptide (TPR) repeat protein